MHNYSTDGKRSRGKRGGISRLSVREYIAREVAKDIHCKVRGVAVHRSAKSNFTATVTDNAIYYPEDCGDIVNGHVTKADRELGIDDRKDGTIYETEATHIVPRKSQSKKQLLGILPQTVDFELIKGWQISYQTDKVTGKVVEVREPIERYRVAGKSDGSLLLRKPSDRIGTFKREGSISQGSNTRKYRKTENEDALNANLIDDVSGKVHPFEIVPEDFND